MGYKRCGKSLGFVEKQWLLFRLATIHMDCGTEGEFIQFCLFSILRVPPFLLSFHSTIPEVFHAPKVF